MSFVYVASPYTNRDSQVMYQRFLMTERYTARALINKHWVYSPIVHCHEMAQRYRMPTDFDFWREYNYAMLNAASALEVLQLPGWAESRGVSDERAFAEKHEIPITLIKPEHLWLRPE